MEEEGRSKARKNGEMEKHEKTKLRLFLRLCQYSSTPILQYPKNLIPMTKATYLDLSLL